MFATGFNAKFISENGIGPGARIKIVRSGDVIPYIAQVITPALDWAKPTISWKWVGQVDITPTDMAHAPEFLNKQLLHFFTTLGVDGIRAGTLDKLIGAGFDSINLILDLEVANLLDVAGFQITSATKLVDNIKEFVLDKEHPLPVLMTASNLFPGFGIKKLEPLVVTLDIRKILTNTITKTDVLAIPGFSDVSASKFMDTLPAFINWLAEHPQLRVANPKKPANKSATPTRQTPVTGKVIVFTGFRDKDMADKLAGMGSVIVDSISTSTNIIVAKDPDASSSKLDKARERGITIMGIPAFKAFAGL
jgi:NAD-dependent DNA ligase